MGIYLSIAERKAVCLAHGRSVEVVVVICMNCGVQKKKEYCHGASNHEIARRCFPRWKIRGVNRAKVTRCQKCKGGTRG